MKAKTIQTIKNFIKSSDDFFDVYKIELQKEINKSHSILSDIVFESLFKPNNAKQGVRKTFNTFVDSFIDGMTYDGNIDYYFMDKQYLDIAWLKVDGDIINIDDLFIDFKAYCQG